MECNYAPIGFKVKLYCTSTCKGFMSDLLLLSKKQGCTPGTRWSCPHLPTQCATTVVCKYTSYMHVLYRIIIFMPFDYSLWQESHNGLGGQLAIKAEGR